MFHTVVMIRVNIEKLNWDTGVLVHCTAMRIEKKIIINVFKHFTCTKVFAFRDADKKN